MRPAVRCSASKRLLALVLLLGAISMPGADYTVTITNDNLATGSLRWAISNVNVNGATAPHRILFNLPTNTTTIFLTNGPTVAVTVLIDGSSQPHFAGQPIVELRGSSANNSSGLTLAGASSNITVRSLVINRFTNDGITILNPSWGNRIEGCYIGTDRTGTNFLANGEYGIFISSSPRNTIGGPAASQRNVIAGYRPAAGLRPAIGLLNAGATGNIIQGNYVGIGANGVTRVGRGYGILLDGCPSNQIGGTVTGAGNVISGNNATGVALYGTATKGNVIQGNIIGLNPAGTLAVSNGADGVTIEGGSGNLIGGTESGARNVISGNDGGGIHIKALTGAGGSNNIVQGNFIGTDITGRQARGNESPGVTITGVRGNQIGGVSAAARNVIAGNLTAGVAVSTNSAANRIEGNFIGVDATGTNALGNGTIGVAVDSAFNNTLGGSVAGAGNVISGNTNHGVFLTGATATNNTVSGNFIGTDATGGKALKNAVNGVHVFAPGNWIGGTTTAERNVISGNGVDGIFLDQAASRGTTIQGNYVGTDAGGTKRLGNALMGIRLFISPSNTIGGTVSGARNIVSANGDAAILLTSNSAAGNVIQGNYIGTDASGTASLNNPYEGIYLWQATNNTIGGTTAGAGNLISGGNPYGGVYLLGASRNTIQGNFMGTKADGISPLANQGHGVAVDTNSHNNLIGGTTANAGNVLAFAPGTFCGVRIWGGATNNAILGNSIFSNGGVGIDLGVGGFTANDNCDPDGGANLLQNFPVLTNAIVGNGSGIQIRGSLNSLANRTFRLQFFANPAADSSGYGEGQIYLGGDILATVGASCATNFSVNLPASVPAGYWISATATDPANNTSEFSASIPARPLPALRSAVAVTNDNQATVAWTWTNTGVSLSLKESDSITRPLNQWWTASNGVLFQLNTTNWLYKPALTNEHRFYKLALP